MTPQPKVEPGAFPCPDDYTTEGRAIYGPKNLEGMTLRDYFAAKAMQSLIIIPAVIPANFGNLEDFAYSVANQMLTARAKTGGLG